MRADQLLESLRRLNLKPASKHAAEALGVSLRQLQRMTAGHVPVPRPVALLTISYLKRGLPNPLWNPEIEKSDAIEGNAGTLLAKMNGVPSPARSVLPEAQKIEAAAARPGLPKLPEPAPEPPIPIRSTTRRPAALSRAYIKEIADRAERKTVSERPPSPSPRNRSPKHK
jgi:hypothetical protein